jgi:NAD(P)-dependent dehydrogenase (short-subunit alcohol dehydrogenase family)
MTDLFDLTGRVAAITGGAGLMGMQHAEVIAAHGGIPVLVDIVRAREKAADLAQRHNVRALACQCDITQPESVRDLLKETLAHFGRVDILINNAANNPKMENSTEVNFSRLENFPIEQWQADLAVGLTGAHL